MNKLKVLSSLGLATTVALTLVGCGQSNKQASTNVKDFKMTVPKKAEKEGGTVKVAVETDTPFTGIFSNELESTAIDSSIASPGSENLFAINKNYKIIDGGAANLKLNRKDNTATITINPKVKWSDGQPLVAKDVEYAYEIIANKDTQSERYTGSLQLLRGLSEYHDGKSDKISGIDMPDGPDGKKVVLHYKELKPSMIQSGNGYIWESAAPYHYLKDVPFKKLISSEKIRKKPLYWGPYVLQKVVRGQSVTWVPNKNYYKGKPKLDKIVQSVVSPNSASQAIKSNKFDIINVVNSQWKNVKDAKGYNFVAKIPLGYSYLGFKVGKWDSKTGKNVMNPKAKMNNRSLRQAIAYGMNIDEVYKRYANGLSFRIPTLIQKEYGKYFDKNVKGYTYNIKKGNELLDKAGYKKKGEYRVQPNGKPLTIHLAAMTGSSIQEPIIQNYIQQWKKLGLKVKLTSGRLMEMNSFYDKVQHDDPSIDMFLAGFSSGSEPSPNDLYSETAPFNFTRFVTKENNQLLEQMNSQKAFDQQYRYDKFHEWQAYMDKEAYVVPTVGSYSITAVNNKITGYSLDPTASWFDIAYAK